MQKHVVVIYDFYEPDPLNSSVRRIPRWERVPFCAENVEYDESLSYSDNVRNFVSDCLESQAVYIGEKYIPIHNIHGFYFDKEDKQVQKLEKTEDNKSVQPQNNGNSGNPPKFNQQRRHGKWKAIKHKNRERMNAASTLPFKVETNSSVEPAMTSIIQSPEQLINEKA